MEDDYVRENEYRDSYKDENDFDEESLSYKLDEIRHRQEVEEAEREWQREHQDNYNDYSEKDEEYKEEDVADQFYTDEERRKREEWELEKREIEDQIDAFD